jgi:Brp/Blh family beta-carotene 15,15'-monooxygenase
VPWSIAGFVIALSCCWPALAQMLAVPCFLASALILGMPHGATDLYLPSVVRAPGRASLRWAGFLAGYVGLVAVAVLVRQFSPWIFFWSFLALTAFHWGTGDFTAIRSRRTAWLACGLSRGALVVSCIVCFGVLETAELVRFLTGAQIQVQQWRGVALPSFSVALALHALALLWSARRISLSVSVSLSETVLIVLLFATAPLYLALSVYFMGFHAQRHLGRMLRMTGRGTDLRSWLRAHWELAAAGVGVILLGWCSLPYWGAKVSSGHDIVAPYVVLLGFLTLPHALLIAWLDCSGREQLTGELSGVAARVRCVETWKPSHSKGAMHRARIECKRGNIAVGLR